jgi:hypothetical protein
VWGVCVGKKHSKHGVASHQRGSPL